MHPEIEKMMVHNRNFVANKEYEQYAASKFPSKKTAIVTCMDTRLVQLLPAALGIKNGDVKMIKNAGGMITDPFDTTVRSLLVAIYELGVENIMVVGHTNCGVQGMEGKHFIEQIEKRGVNVDTKKIKEQYGVDVENWLTGFDETENAVLKSVELLENHPLIPENVEISGYVIDTDTGQLRPVNKA